MPRKIDDNIEEEALEQARRISHLPFIAGHIALLGSGGYRYATPPDLTEGQLTQITEDWSASTETEGTT